jgi:hypothetical protein
MVLCDNVFCAGETIEFEYVTLAGRRFCCIACAEDWHHQNEVLAEAAAPFHTPAIRHDRKTGEAGSIRRRVPKSF